MAALFISAEDQIQRLNTLHNRLMQLRSLPIRQLVVPSSPKAWSIIEIVAHLNSSYSLYKHRLDQAVTQCPAKDTENERFKARAWQRFVINGQRPKGNVRKWKMKTLKRFEPLLDVQKLTETDMDTIFNTWETDYHHLKNTISNSRNLDLSKVKIASAIGPIVNFYLPECFEFLICHTERHWVQISETLVLFPKTTVHTQAFQ